MFFSINFGAVQNAVDDQGITQQDVWDPKTNTKVPAPKGRGFGRLNVEPFLDAGIGVATFYYGDVDPDYLSGFLAWNPCALFEARTPGPPAGGLGIDCCMGVGNEPRGGLL
jgi:hypothetical protein